MKKTQVGLLIPWVNTAMEEEIPYLVHPDIGLHWVRLKPKKMPRDGHDTSYLESMIASIPEALSRFEGLIFDIIVLGCTSASFYSDLNKIYRGNSRFVTAFDAIIFQLKKLKAHKILLFAPYDATSLQREKELLERHGFSVLESVMLTYKYEIRYISAEYIYSTIIRHYLECDAVLLSCTALYTLDVIKKIENYHPSLAPVISSNLAIARTLNDIYYEME